MAMENFHKKDISLIQSIKLNIFLNEAKWQNKIKSKEQKGQMREKIKNNFEEIKNSFFNHLQFFI